MVAPLLLATTPGALSNTVVGFETGEDPLLPVEVDEDVEDDSDQSRLCVVGTGTTSQPLIVILEGISATGKVKHLQYNCG